MGSLNDFDDDEGQQRLNTFLVVYEVEVAVTTLEEEMIFRLCALFLLSDCGLKGSCRS